MAQNAPWGLKNSKIFWGRPQTPPPPVAWGHPPSHIYPQLALCAKLAALPPSLVPAIAIFVPPTSNLNKNPVLDIYLCVQLQPIQRVVHRLGVIICPPPYTQGCVSLSICCESNDGKYSMPTLFQRSNYYNFSNYVTFWKSHIMS